MSPRADILVWVAGRVDKRGSFEDYLLRLAAALRREALRMHVVAGPSWDTGLVRDLAAEGVTMTGLPDAALRSPLAAAGVLLRTRPRLLHYHFGSPSSLLAGLATTLGVRRFVFTDHGSRSLAQLADQGGWKRAMRRLRALPVDLYLPVSAEVGRHLHREIGVPARKVRPLMNGIDLSRYEPVAEAERQALRRRLFGIGPADPLLLFAGQLTEEKGVPDLRAVQPALLAAFPNLTIAWAGDGPLRDAVQASAGPRIRVLGRRTDVPDLLRAADLVAAPLPLERGLLADPRRGRRFRRAGGGRAHRRHSGSGGRGRDRPAVPPRRPRRIAGCPGHAAGRPGAPRRHGHRRPPPRRMAVRPGQHGGRHHRPLRQPAGRAARPLHRCQDHAMSTAETIVRQLEEDGIAPLPMLLPPEALNSLQRAFSQALLRPSFNTWVGYEQNEKWRLLVENLLALHPANVDLALHPLVTEPLRRYIGADFALTEARGWRTVATRRNFHGWHADAWHDPSVDCAPREVKLAVYLSDVETGHFAYLAGSHRPRRPARHWSPAEVEPLLHRERAMRGPAGTCFLFDTAGVHRQTTPCLTPRDVMFFNFHDPAVRIQAEDVAAGRYRPLALNAGFLPPLDAEAARILGFGRNRAEPEDAVVGRAAVRRYPVLHDLVAATLAARLEYQDLAQTARRARRFLGRRLARLMPGPKPAEAHP